jgi:hypothetical protein
MLKRTSIITALAVVALASPRAALALAVTVQSHDDNGWDLRSEDLTKVNLIDCLDGVDYTFAVDLQSVATTGRTLYLYEGTSCNDSPEACRIIGESQIASDLTFVVAADVLLDTGCETSGTASVWAALLEQENQAEGAEGTIEGIWSEALSVTLDFEGPSAAPTGLSTRVGSGNVRVSWDALSDVSGFRVVVWDGTGFADTDTATDTDTGTDEDAGADTDTATDTDTDADAGADGGAGKGGFEPRAADAGVSEECTISGGFTAGGEYDHTLVSDFTDSEAAHADATSATISGLENGVQYKFAVVSLDESANPSVFSEVVCATPEKTIGFGDLYDDAGGKGDGQFCFIATAAFGSYDHPAVRILRTFRDEFLAKLPGGRSAIAAYYAAGPTLASAIEGHEALRGAVAEGLIVASGAAICLVAVGPTGFAFGFAACVLAGLIIGLALPRRRRAG